MNDPSDGVKSIIESHYHLAIVVGNGINRYDNPNGDSYGWNKLIESLWRELNIDRDIPIGSDLSLTEAYDIISLLSDDDSILSDQVKSFVNKIKPTQYHDCLCQRMHHLGIPVLTTNFDGLLERNLKKYRMKHPNAKNQGFSDYYPWDVYYSYDNNELINPLSGFGVWHINGSVAYSRSMRLGLTHYMNQVSRVRSFIHSKNKDDTFIGKNRDNWKGYNTWLHIVFNCPLLIMGLALDINETFLRWLLIERASFFKINPDLMNNECTGWYLCPKCECNSAKRSFLSCLGFKTIEFEDYQKLYKSVLI